MNYKVEDDIKISGKVRVVGYDRDGNIVYEYETHNLVVDVGKQNIIDILIGASSGTIYQIGVGSDGTAVSASDTDLISLIMWHDYTERFRNGFELHVTAYFSGSEANGTWQELGLRTSDAKFIARAVITSWSKTSSYSSTVEWILEIS